MAHKGKNYPVKQRGRLYSGEALWPDFPARHYDLNAGFIGYGGPPINFSAPAAPVVGWSPGDWTMVWRGSAGTWSGQAVELGFVIDLLQSWPDWTCYGQMWLDGVPQVTPHNSGTQFLACRQMADTVTSALCSFPPIATAGIGSFGCLAVPW